MIRLLILLALMIVPELSQATIDWEDGFEYASKSAMDSAWPSSCPGDGNAMQPSTDRAHSGSRSLKEIFHGHQDSGDLGPATPGYDSCFMERNLNAGTEVLFVRFYVWLENFTPNPVVTKMTKFFSSTYPDVGMNMFNGQTDADMAVEGAGPNLDAISMDGPAIPQNQWVCIEAELHMNTAGVADGIIKNWVNGTLGINRTDLLMRGATLNGTTPPNSPTAVFASVQLYVQDGGVYSGSGTTYTNNIIYYDDYAVSRDARIGCIGGGGGGSIVMFITQSAVVIATFLQVLFIGGYFWERRTVAVQAAVKFWRYAAEAPTPKEMYWAYRYKKAVNRWQKQAPLMLEYQPMMTIELPKVRERIES